MAKKCPNCGFEAPEGAAECTKCQIIFGKWTEREERMAAPAMEGGMEAAPAPASSLPWVIGAALIAGSAGWYFLKPDPGLPVHAQEAQTEESSPGGTQEAGEEAGTSGDEASAPVIENPWKFEGTVKDVVRGTPVQGAKLVFSSPREKDTFTAETDFSGRYFLDLKPLEKGGYEVSIAHPDYGGQWYDARILERPKRERYRLSEQVQFRASYEWSRHVGRENGISTYDFAIYPNNLSEDERREQFDAISGGPARD